MGSGKWVRRALLLQSWAWIGGGMLCAGLASAEEAAEKKPESPWLLTPTLSSSPKMGNSLGAMAGYLFKADEGSPTSMVAAMGSYSDTDSSVYGAFSRLYFAEDRHRVLAGVVHGNIENSYEDFLGTGLKAETTDDLNIGFVQYLRGLPHGWYVGAQVLAMDYEIKARDQKTQTLLTLLGLTGFSSNALGLVIERDTRNQQNSPRSGSWLNVSNSAFRESLGGDVSFDAYSANFSHYWGFAERHVVASRVTGRWTNDAPRSGYSSVDLRGYTRGEYLAPNATSIEVEERYQITTRWGATAFVGAACLYGEDAACDSDENWFPAAGAGVTYLLKPEEGMVVRLEFASGKGDNHGLYMQFGNAF